MAISKIYVLFTYESNNVDIKSDLYKCIAKKNVLCFPFLGDIGFYEDDTHVTISDRLKELIKVKGFQVRVIAFTILKN